MTIDRYMCPSCKRAFESNDIMYVPPVSFDTEHKSDGYYEMWCPLCGRYIAVWEDCWEEWLQKYRVE